MIRYLAAAILIIIGLGFFLDELHIWQFGFIISTWWPLIIITLGLIAITRSRNSVQTGAIILLIGLLLQASRLGMLPGGFWGTFWPLLLIIIGFSIIFSKFQSHKRRFISDDEIHYSAFFSGTKQAIDSQNFMGGEISTVFGGAEIDLRNALLSSAGATIDLSVAFGGIEIKVPNNWKIKTKGLPIFGALEDKTRGQYQSDTASVLNINYFVMFGGIDIKN